MTTKRESLVLGISALILIGVGVAAGHWLTPKPVHELSTYRPEIIQPDGSHIAERKPLTVADAGKPPHQLPRGSKEERRGKVTVKPRPPAYGAQPGCACEPIDLTYSLTRDKDGGRSIVWSSGNGEIVHAEDSPIGAGTISSRSSTWSVGGLYEPRRQGYGVIAQRHFGRLAVGGAVLKPGNRAGEAWVVATLNF